MMQRFNFFDIYGYLIPGGFFLGMLALPFVLSIGLPEWPAVTVTAVGLVGSYVAGHVLYGVARSLIANQVTGADGHERSRSDLILDKAPDQGGLAAPVRAKLKLEVDVRFHLDIDQRAQRADAFFLCRTAIMQAKIGSYVEQYQGLNSMARGLAAGCVLLAFFYLGWISKLHFPGRPRWSFGSAVVVTVGPFAVLWVVVTASAWLRKRLLGRLKSGSWAQANPPHNKPSWLRQLARRLSGALRLAEGALLGLGLLAIGAACSPRFPIGPRRILCVLLAAAASAFMAWRFDIAARSFDESLAKSVYRDFVVAHTAHTANE